MLQGTAQEMQHSRQPCLLTLGQCVWFMLSVDLTLRQCAVSCPSPEWSRRSWRRCCTTMLWSSVEKLAVARPHRSVTLAAQSCCAPLCNFCCAPLCSAETGCGKTTQIGHSCCTVMLCSSVQLLLCSSVQCRNWQTTQVGSQIRAVIGSQITNG